MPTPRFLAHYPRAALRIALSYYITNGMSAALGLLLISGVTQWIWGPFAAAAASVGVVVVIPPDQAAPRHGKFWHLLPAAVIGLPLFYSIQKLHFHPVLLGLLLTTATFFAFLGAAWGKRGIPISISVMFSMVFSMAVPTGGDTETAWSSSLFFLLGAASYLIYGTLANAVLNARYRAVVLADTLHSLAALVRAQARQFTPASTDDNSGKAPLVGEFMRRLATLADQLQMARNILLESPRTPRRQQLAGMLMQVLEMRDHLLACELDLDTLKSHPGHAPVLDSLRAMLESLAWEIEDVADSLLLGVKPASFESFRPRLAELRWPEDAPLESRDAQSPAILARGLAGRVGHINDEILLLVALARGEAEPDLAVVRAAWQMFVSPTTWSWHPSVRLWRRDAALLRHAIRAALAIGTAYGISLRLPWGTHDYWILLTIVVVLRGSFAQTVERRNSRAAGTFAGCLLVALLLAFELPTWALILILTLAQGVAHGFATRRYLVTAVAATVLGLVQAHMLIASQSPLFDAIERMADTLLGVTLAWAFSYVLPSWERSQIPSLIARTLAAQAVHCRVALALGQLQAVDNEPEIEWRLARREAYDSLSALVMATQQSLAEPRAVRPPLDPLGRFLAHSYQLLAQLTAVKTMLLLRRERLDHRQLKEPLQRAAETITATLAVQCIPEPGAVRQPAQGNEPLRLPDPFDNDLNPWALRRLDLATAVASKLRDDADQVLRMSTAAASSHGP